MSFSSDTTSVADICFFISSLHHFTGLVSSLSLSFMASSLRLHPSLGSRCFPYFVAICQPVRVDFFTRTVVLCAALFLHFRFPVYNSLDSGIMSALRRVRKYFISSQVYEALRPLFFLTFLYGLTPFHVVRKKMGESYLKMSFFGVFNIFIYICLCGFCYISSLRQGESIVGYFFRTEISTIGDRLQIFNGLIAGAVIYTSAILKRCKLLGTLTILHSLDTNFSNIGIRVKYSRIFRYSILVLVFKLLILGVYFVGVFRLLVSLNVTPSFCVCMTFFLQHTVVSIAICLFCVIAFSFERRLSIINQVSNICKYWRVPAATDSVTGIVTKAIGFYQIKCGN